MKYRVDVIVVVATVEDDGASKAVWSKNRTIGDLESATETIDALKFALRSIRSDQAILQLTDAVIMSRS